MTKIKILSQEEINEGLKNLPGWIYKDNKISKEYILKDFMDSLDFINRLAPYFEKMDHHPDLDIRYNKVLVGLQRFDIGGKVTDLDLAVAQEIEEHFSTR